MALGDLYKLNDYLLSNYGFKKNKIYLEIGSTNYDFVILKNERGMDLAFCRRREVIKVAKGLLVEKY